MVRKTFPLLAVVGVVVLLLGSGAMPASAHTFQRTVTVRASAQATVTAKVSVTMHSGGASATRSASARASARATASARVIARGRSARAANARARHAARRLAHARALRSARQLARARARAKALAAAKQQALAAARKRGTGASVQPCGGVPVVQVGTASWGCTLDEEFDGTSLDRNLWHVVRTDEYGFFSGPECYVDDAQHVAVGGGVLTLTVTRAPTCPVTGGNYQSGAVASYAGFAQRYGRFAIRAKLPDTTSVQPALWMYPYSSSYGAWPASGEIDIAEGIGDGAGTVWPHLHYLDAGGTDPHPGTGCQVAHLSTEFHVFQVDWTPTLIRFSYDGKTCFSVGSWTPEAPLLRPQPFDQPFFIQLELALGNGIGVPQPSAATKLPTQMQVDWVRAWGAK